MTIQRLRPETQECLTCGGRGETTHRNPVRPSDPTLETTHPCVTCDGAGVLPADVLICDACSMAFLVGDNACDHGGSYCPECRGECELCMAETDTERADPWGDVA